MPRPLTHPVYVTQPQLHIDLIIPSQSPQVLSGIKNLNIGEIMICVCYLFILQYSQSQSYASIDYKNNRQVYEPFCPSLAHALNPKLCIKQSRAFVKSELQIFSGTNLLQFIFQPILSFFLTLCPLSVFVSRFFFLSFCVSSFSPIMRSYGQFISLIINSIN